MIIQTHFNDLEIITSINWFNCSFRDVTYKVFYRNFTIISRKMEKIEAYIFEAQFIFLVEPFLLAFCDSFFSLKIFQYISNKHLIILQVKCLATLGVLFIKHGRTMRGILQFISKKFCQIFLLPITVYYAITLLCFCGCAPWININK